jgi:hypothetical protein
MKDKTARSLRRAETFGDSRARLRVAQLSDAGLRVGLFHGRACRSPRECDARLHRGGPGELGLLGAVVCAFNGARPHPNSLFASVRVSELNVDSFVVPGEGDAFDTGGHRSEVNPSVHGDGRGR